MAENPLPSRGDSVSSPLLVLRERSEEILPIAGHYLQNYGQKFRKPVKGFSKAAEAALCEYSWPGNIRELINAVERAAI